MGRAFKPTGSPTRQRRKQQAKLPPFEPARKKRQMAMPEGEMKYFDCEATSVALGLVTTTWVAGTITDPETTINLGDAAVATPLCLVAPKVSAALNGRVGRSIHVRKIKVRGHISVPEQAGQTTADPASLCRILLVQDTQTNTAQMTGAQLFNDASGAQATINAFQNPNNFGRFKVLKDKMLVLQDPNLGNDTGATGGGIQNGRSIPFKFNVNFRTPVKVQFNATNGGTVADIVDNSFHILAATNSSALGPLINYYSRVAYKDT